MLAAYVATTELFIILIVQCLGTFMRKLSGRLIMHFEEPAKSNA